MLQPMRTKFRKAHKGRIKGLATSAVDLAFGHYGLKAMEPERVTARQIEAARRALTRHMKRAGQVWIFKGEIMEHDPMASERRLVEGAEQGSTGRRREAVAS